LRAVRRRLFPRPGLFAARLGTFPPARRAWESPIAIACLRLLTFLPDPERSVPRFRSCMAALTLAAAFFPYLAIERHLLRRVSRCEGCANAEAT
jgi:hypothetical protein